MWKDEQTAQHVVPSREIVPLLSTGTSPIAAISGRGDLLDALGDTRAKLPRDLAADSDAMEYTTGYSNLLRILELRNQLSMFGDNRSIATRNG